MYVVVTPEQFLRVARKFFGQHPDLKPHFAKLLDELQRDPYQSGLRLHALSGKLTGCYAVSLTYSYRITLTLMMTEKEIVLLDIGSHDEVYR